MPGGLDAVSADPVEGSWGFSVTSQKVELNVDFAARSLSGTTQLIVQPTTKDLKVIRLNCRQCRILRARVEDRLATVAYLDPYEKTNLRESSTSVYQHEYLRSKIQKHVRDSAAPELAISLPARLAIKEVQGEFPLEAAPSLERRESDAFGKAETPTLQSAQEQGPRYAPLKVDIEFYIKDSRDGIHFVGVEPTDARYPHLFTRNNGRTGTISSVFPCLDTVSSRCMWEISIRTPRTLEDAFRVQSASALQSTNGALGGSKQVNGLTNDDSTATAVKDTNQDLMVSLSTDEKALELAVVCSGEMTDDIIDPADPSRRTVSFACLTPVAPRHIAFAIGPFENVDLSEFRQVDGDDKLGQNAIRVQGYCLPGRAEELRNTCLPLAKTIDFFTVNYGSFPFPSYKVCFVDDLVQDVTDAAGFTLCSNRLLFPDDIVDVLDENTRVIVRAAANQYAGVNVIPKDATDLWIVAGIAGFMTDIFMKKLAGNNEYRFRQKLASDKIYELDVDRYSIHQLGQQLDIDPSEYEFLALKSSLVLFILDRRLTKASGSAGVPRIINKIFLNAKTGEMSNGEISTDYFLRICEKLGHAKLDLFFRQWVYGAGCPKFEVTQRFNKKKLVVEMSIIQQQMSRGPAEIPSLTTSTFLREAKEQVSEAYAPAVQPVFTGPMTIRIHEADGTPYEHIVEIKEATTKIDIPYNTKYKRLKRSKRAKERAIATNGPETTGDAQDDVLLYCLGDTLQSEAEVQEWRLRDWDKAMEDSMGAESYEWIRMDADFEWIGKIHISMPTYMYVSQLQQDRDVVAQYESIHHVLEQQPHPLGSTFMIRTLMDRRYFHGIRTIAAMGLVKTATEQNGCQYIGQYHLEKAFTELFCHPGSVIPRPNNFADRASYLIQCAIPRAMARIRDPSGRVPLSLQRFFIDKIKFNDNSDNELSDCYYLCTLLSCVKEALAAGVTPAKNYAFNFGDEDELDVDPEETQLKEEALKEIERYRRIDEWISSYQNTFTIESIACLEQLSASGAVKSRAADILQYTRAGNGDNVRLKAFAALVNLNMARKPQIMKYILHNFGDDPSPYMRDQLLRIVGQALGSIAIGDDNGQGSSAIAVKSEANSGLVLEQEAGADVRRTEIARKTPEGALEALRASLSDDKVFKSALWHATLSPLLSLDEIASMLDVAALLFEPSTALIVSLRIPRYYKVEHLGKGKLLFSTEGGFLRKKPSEYKGLEPADWRRVKENGLVYNGPVSKAARMFDAEAEAATQGQKEQDAIAAKIAATQREIDRQEELRAAASLQKSSQKQSQMSPPPLPRATPTESTPAGSGGGGGGGGGVLKLSLKRKQSVDLGGASSPKVQKTQKSQTVAAPNPAPTKIKTQAAASSPAAAAATPKSEAVPRIPSKPLPAGVKGAKSRIVKLKTFGVGDRIAKILSQQPKHQITSAAEQRTPAPQGVPQNSPPASASPSLGSGGDKSLFSSKPTGFNPMQAGWNVGGFRNYGSAPPATGTAATAASGSPTADSASSPLSRAGSSVLSGGAERAGDAGPGKDSELRDVAVKREGSEFSASGGLATAPTTAQATNGAGPALSTTATAAAADATPVPPPKRKLTIKFSRKPADA